jgi:Fe-S cluster biogenesis protein NfuA
MNTSNMMERINKALDQIRPYLQADGGDVVVKEITQDMTLIVRLTGACNGCPFSVHTLRAGVEQVIRKEVPEIKQVLAVE